MHGSKHALTSWLLSNSGHPRDQACRRSINTRQTWLARGWRIFFLNQAMLAYPLHSQVYYTCCRGVCVEVMHYRRYCTCVTVRKKKEGRKKSGRVSHGGRARPNLQTPKQKLAFFGRPHYSFSSHLTTPPHLSLIHISEPTRPP